jgi:hypothetical protein
MIGLAQAPAGSVDDHPVGPFGTRADANAERLQRETRAVDIVAVGDAGDPGLTVGERGEEQRSVRDALVAGEAQASAQWARAHDREFGWDRHDSGVREEW